MSRDLLGNGSNLSISLRLRAWCVCLMFIFMMALAPLAPAQPVRWWDNTWRWRVKVVPDAPARGSTAAQAQFPIPPGCAAGGRDVRVADDQGRLCRMRVMYFQPGLYGIVAFERTDASVYYIYLGNPAAAGQTAAPSSASSPAAEPDSAASNPRAARKAAKKAKAARKAGKAVAPSPSAAPPAAGGAWEPQAGVFLETRRLTGGEARNPNQFRQLAAEATYSFGAGYRDRIYEGLNPFGEPEHYLSLYEAYFNAPVGGEYLFATISKDASFLLVDGTPVCQWPGAHDASGGARAQHNGKIRLTRGAHRLDYYHADYGGERQCVVAAWMPPGVAAPRPMEPPDFIPIAACQTGTLEEHGAALSVDWRAAQTARLIREGETCTAWQFSGVTPAGLPPEGCLWQFSDGTRYAGASINKVFFTGGDVSITLTARDGAGHTATATRPFRVHAIADLKDPGEERMLPYFADVAAQMPPGALALPDALAAARLLAAAKRPAEAARAYQDVVERAWQSGKKIDEDSVRKLMGLFTNELRKPSEAETLLRAQLARAGQGSPERGRLMLALGHLQLGPLNQPEAALATLRAARPLVEKTGDTVTRRELLIALGDACFATAAPDEAATAYQAAEALTTAAEREKYDRSSFALATEAYLRDGLLGDATNELDHWTSLYPGERLTGYATVLQARLMTKQKNTEGAVVLLERFLKCKPLGAFAQMALEDLADDYRELNKPAEARAAYQKILDQFQDESVLSRIRNKLDEMNKADAGK